VKFIPFSSSARPLAGEFRAQRISPSLPHDRRTRNRLSESLLPLVRARKNRQKSRRRNGFAGFSVGLPQGDPRHFSRRRVQTCRDCVPRHAIFGSICGEGAKLSSQGLGDTDGNNRRRTADDGHAAFDRGGAVLASLSQEPISKSRQHPCGLPKYLASSLTGNACCRYPGSMRGFGTRPPKHNAGAALGRGNAMRYGHGVGPRGALCHLHDKSRSDFMRNRDEFAIRLLSRRNLA